MHEGSEFRSKILRTTQLININSLINCFYRKLTFKQFNYHNFVLAMADKNYENFQENFKLLTLSNFYNSESKTCKNTKANGRIY